MSTNDELRSFLMSRRALLDPAQVGLLASSRRRVSGLRREEVAVRANLSVDYYTQVEQGRQVNPSRSVLNAIADALLLDDAQREYLARLASPHDDTVPGTFSPLRSGIVRMLAGMRLQGALVVDSRMHVLAANRIADALMEGWIAAGEHGGNLAVYIFRDATARLTHPDWDAVAASMVATLRYGVARRSDDPILASVIAELRAEPAFTALWDRHDVDANTFGSKRFLHNEHILVVDYEVLLVPDDGDVRLTIYSATPGTAAADFFETVDRSWPAGYPASQDPWVVTPAPPSPSTFLLAGTPRRLDA